MATISKRPGIPSNRSHSYDPAKRMPGAFPEVTYPPIRVNVTDAETVAEVNDDSIPQKFNGTTTSYLERHKLKDALREVQGDASIVREKKPPTLTHENEVPLSESTGNKISGEPTTLPKFLQNEYYRSAMNDEEDQVTFVEDGASGMGWLGEFEAKDRSSDRAMGGYVLGDGFIPLGFGEGDVAVGNGGVTFHRSGRGDILPGYPTQEGMMKLIFDRMVDDQLRSAGAENPTAIPRSNNSSEGFPTNFPRTNNNQEGRTVPCLDFRILEEKRETPILENSVPAASQIHYEDRTLTLPAVPTTIPRSTSITACSLDPVGGSRAVEETPVSKSVSPTATDQLDSTFWKNGDSELEWNAPPRTLLSDCSNPEDTSRDVNSSTDRVWNGREPRVSDSTVEAVAMGGSEVSYLGRPI